MADITISTSPAGMGSYGSITAELINNSTQEVKKIGVISIGNKLTIPSGNYTFKVYAEPTFRITDTRLKMGGWNDTMDISPDGKTATYTDYDSMLYGTLSVTVEKFDEPIPPKMYEIDLRSEEGSIYAEFEKEGEIIRLETGINTVEEGTYNVTFFSNLGYKLESARINGGGWWLTFDINPDQKKTGVEEYSVDRNTYAQIETTYQQPETDVVGFNNLYLVDSTILKELSKERFLVGEGIDTKLIDLGTYILNVLELPFPIVEEIKGIEDKIKLGNNLLTVSALFLTKDEMVLDLGTITVPQKYFNSYDYLETNIYLHLPFTNRIEIDVNYAIGQEISVQYVIDLYSGDTTIIVSSSYKDIGIIYSNKTKLGKNIPFINKMGGVVGDLQTNVGLNNKLYQCYIEVIRNKPFEIDSQFNETTTRKTKLLNETGLVSVNNIVLDVECTLSEKNSIISILGNGVVIK